MNYLTRSNSKFKYKLNDLAFSEMFITALKKRNWGIIKYLVKIKVIEEM